MNPQYVIEKQIRDIQVKMEECSSRMMIGEYISLQQTLERYVCLHLEHFKP